jgi:hypothetical protein
VVEPKYAARTYARARGCAVVDVGLFEAFWERLREPSRTHAELVLGRRLLV